MIEEDQFQQGQTVLYEKNGLSSSAVIRTIHRDDMPNLYFTILFPDNSEKQTVSKYLSPLPKKAAHFVEAKDSSSSLPADTRALAPGVDLSLSLWDAAGIKELQLHRPAEYRHFSDCLDELGRLSGEAQFLSGPITSVEKLLQHPQQVLLVARQGEAAGSGRGSDRGKMVGFLKYGPKDLFFYNKKGKVKEYPRCMCLLDFYVQQTQQRQGCGLVLFREFLRQAEAEWNAAAVSRTQAGARMGDGSSGTAAAFGPHLLAYDRPSPKLLPFLKKHYGLSKPDLQPNKYTIFEGFPLPR